MKAVVYTLGCKLNQYESFSLSNELIQRGYEVSEELAPADLYVINTCAVTSEAERKSRQVLSKIDKLNPSAKVIICGCASQRSPESFLKRQGNLLVTGSFNKAAIIDFLGESGVKLSGQPDEYEDNLFPLSPRTRAYVKVQDGCDSFCAYCIIPYLRGRSRSRKEESVLGEITRLSQSCKEFVLTGINLSGYGKDTGSSLPALVRSLSGADVRIRLGSLEASAIDDELMQALKGLKQFCPHFHLSLQSGSDGVLADMNRRYNAEFFLRAVETVRRHFPDAAVTTDVIVGFPTESEEDFEQSCRVCSSARFADIHIFPYSPREGTKAYSLKPLAKSIVDLRKQRLAELRDNLKREFIQRFAGKQLEMLAEESRGSFTSGYTGNYIRCYAERELEENRLYNVKVIRPHLDGALCELV